MMRVTKSLDYLTNSDLHRSDLDPGLVKNRGVFRNS